MKNVSPPLLVRACCVLALLFPLGNLQAGIVPDNWSPNDERIYCWSVTCKVCNAFACSTPFRAPSYICSAEGVSCDKDNENKTLPPTNCEIMGCQSPSPAPDEDDEQPGS